jgi:sodium/bile acid cotransporter 7
VLQVFRELVPGAVRFTRDYKTFLSLFSTTSLALIIWQTLSSARALLVQQAFVNILYVILLAVAQHLLYLAVNYAVCWWASICSLCPVFYQARITVLDEVGVR